MMLLGSEIYINFMSYVILSSSFRCAMPYIINNCHVGKAHANPMYNVLLKFSLSEENIVYPLKSRATDHVLVRRR